MLLYVRRDHKDLLGWEPSSTTSTLTHSPENLGCYSSREQRRKVLNILESHQQPRNEAKWFCFCFVFVLSTGPRVATLGLSTLLGPPTRTTRDGRPGQPPRLSHSLRALSIISSGCWRHLHSFSLSPRTLRPARVCVWLGRVQDCVYGSRIHSSGIARDAGLMEMFWRPLKAISSRGTRHNHVFINTIKSHNSSAINTALFGRSGSSGIGVLHGWLVDALRLGRIVRYICLAPSDLHRGTGEIPERGRGGGGARVRYTQLCTVTTRMTPALRYEAMRATLMFH